MKKLVSIFISSVITLILFGLGAWWLIEKEVVHFSWSDQYLKKREYNRAQSADSKVLILGDSQLEKWPFEHCLYKDMKHYFDKKEIGYLNAAHFGFGPIEYEQQLKEIASIYKPDYVLLYYYTGNDLTDVGYREKGEVRTRTYPVIFEDSSEVSWVEKRRKSLEGSKGFDWDLFEEKGIDPQIIEYAHNRIERPHEIGPDLVNPHILALGAWKPDNHYDNCSFQSIDTRTAWYNSLKKFTSILKVVDSLKAKLGIVVIPSNVQVDTSHYDFYRRTKFNIGQDLLFANTPQQILHEFSYAAKIPYFDLLPFFKSFERHSELYLENDDHLSELGHSLAFDLLEDQFFEDVINNQKPIDYFESSQYAKNFEIFLVDYEIQKIKQDEDWFKAIKEKAILENRTVEEQLRLDAIYILENY